MDLKEIEWQHVDWTHLAQGWTSGVLINMMINPWVLYNIRDFLTD